MNPNETERKILKLDAALKEAKKLLEERDAAIVELKRHIDQLADQRIVKIELRDFWKAAYLTAIEANRPNATYIANIAVAELNKEFGEK